MKIKHSVVRLNNQDQTEKTLWSEDFESFEFTRLYYELQRATCEIKETDLYVGVFEHCGHEWIYDLNKNLSCPTGEQLIFRNYEPSEVEMAYFLEHAQAYIKSFDYGDGFGSDLVTTVEQDVIADLQALDRERFIGSVKVYLGDSYAEDSRKIVKLLAPKLLPKLEGYLADESSDTQKLKLQIVKSENDNTETLNEVDQRPNESKEEYIYRLHTLIAEAGGPDFRKKVK